MYTYELATVDFDINFYLFGLFILCSCLISCLLFFLSWYLQGSENQYTNIEKLTAYECGFDPFVESHITFDVKFYLISILFIIFDLELIYILPWALYSDIITIFSLNVLIVFLVLMLIGFLYEWCKGALEWV